MSNQNQQVSALDKATKDPRFIQWLHDLTLHGYSKNIMVESDHGEAVALFFLEGKTPEEALPEYAQFKRRWIALNNLQ